jgi:propanediol dehydratase small subunit
MSTARLSIADYPLAENRPEIVRGKRGKGLDEITLDAVVDDRVTLDDLAITAVALRQQAEIAHAAGRPTLAANFERAAELVDVPQEAIMRIYELLRPGRAQSKTVLIEAASELRNTYGASRMAAFVTEAAEVYERRGLFKKRF